ncbi:acyltransferase family protein [Myroides sp. TSA_177.3]|uniref:acyltransferase family protein n=1 Tax=Myroides sp. TSA_177.3 TaxID=3415650 RepID=UPI0040454E58
MQYRPDIQGLRALAVLLVFIFHLNPVWLSGGFIGVDVFFVISGFLVSSIILHKKEKGTFHFLDFYLGRIKRIVPVFLLLLLGVGIVGAWAYVWVDILNLRRTLVAAGLFNSNNYFAHLDTYFGASNQENPLLHTWTLSIEMQFYLLLPLFLWFVRKQYLFVVSLMLVVGLLGYSFYSSVYLNQQSEMYFFLLARIPEFLIGTILAIRADDLQTKFGKYQNPIAWMALVGILACAIGFSEQTVFPGLWVVLPCVFTGCLLLTTTSQVNALFKTKVMVHLGELSYAIYLWHWAIMAFLRYYNMRLDFTLYEMIGITALTYGLSWLSYTYVENVFRTYSNKVFVPRFVGLAVLVVLAGGGIYRMNQYLFPIPAAYATPTFGMESHAHQFKAVGLYGDETKTQPDSICLIGDSHALVYKAILDEIGKDNNFTFWSVSNNRYPLFANINRSDFDKEADYETYEKLMEEVEELTEKSKTILVASAWLEDVPSLAVAFTSLVESLEPDQRMVILGDYPTLDRNPIRATRDYLYNDESMDIQVVHASEPQYVRDAIQKNPEQVLYWQFDFDRTSTLPYFNDTLGYYDEDHLNTFGSRKIGDRVGKDFMAFAKKHGVL